MKRSVLLVHSEYMQKGGEESVVEAEAALLKANGHKVTMFTARNADLLEQSRLQQAQSSIWNKAAATQLRDLAQEHQPDVIHVHNTFPLLSPLVLRYASITGAAVVSTLHNYRSVCLNGILHRDGDTCMLCVGRMTPVPGVVHGCYRGSRIASSLVAGMLVTHRALGTYRNSVDRYIAMSESARSIFESGGLPGDKIAVKSNFLAEDPGPGGVRENACIYVGRLSADKGIMDLISAWPEVGGDMKLRIIGDGPLADQCRQAARDQPRIEYLGPLTRNEVLTQLSIAQFSVFPSHLLEGCPMSIIESLAVGTPVLAANAGAAAEMIEEGVSGWHFVRGDSDSLAQCINRIQNDSAMLQRTQEHARSTFDNKYSSTTNYACLTTIYEEAIANASMTRLRS